MHLCSLPPQPGEDAGIGGPSADNLSKHRCDRAIGRLRRRISATSARTRSRRRAGPWASA